MKVKIISDGSAPGTKVLDETGNPVERVTSISWKVQAGGKASATLTLVEVPVEIVGEAS